MNRLKWLTSLPERAWRHVLCRLWLDRLTFQYERGYAHGMRDAMENAEALASLTPDERAAIISQQEDDLA